MKKPKKFLGLRSAALLRALAVAGLLPCSLQGQTPPRYYLMTDIGPGRALETRSSGGSSNSYTAGNSFVAFGCGPLVTRNGFFLDHNWRLFPLCPMSGDVQSLTPSFEVTGTASVSGRSVSASGLERPTLWNRQGDGTFSAVPVTLPLGSLQGIAFGVDDYGRLTGRIESGGLPVPVYWPSATSAPTMFPLLGAGEGKKIRGNATEALVIGTHGGRFFLWYPTRSSPGNLQFPLGAIPSTPLSLRWTADPPIVTGSMSLPEGMRGFVWRGTPPEQRLGTLGGSVSEAWDILPSSNLIVGGANDAQENRRAVMWEGGAIYDLNQGLLPTCRAGHPTLCAPTLLQSANRINSNGYIAGQALIGANQHAILLRPVGPFNWTLGACAVRGSSLGTSCQAAQNPVFSSASPFSGPVYRSAQAPGGVAQSAVTSQGARARGATTTTSPFVHSQAAFQNYLVIENLSLAKLLPSDSSTDSTVRVMFHFKIKATASTCQGPNSTGGMTADLVVRSARGSRIYASATGSLLFTGSNPVGGIGFFSGHPAGGSFEVVLPVDLSPKSLSAADALDLIFEGTATASFSALNGGQSDCSSGDITVQFCASDPAAVTLEDGTPLAMLGVRYANWPTVIPDPGCVDIPL